MEAEDVAQLSRSIDDALRTRGPEASTNTVLHALVASGKLRALLAPLARLDATQFLATLPKIDDDAPSLDAGLLRPNRAAGELVGPYRLVRPLGRGGMGSVWLAERSDGLIGRRVALKLPHDASPRLALAERLARERDMLATLDHPNIARLYDAGFDGSGCPFIVLEYVDGQRLDEYCQTHAPSLDAKLALFAQVVAAVAHAHAKLIVHRDLKPSNILVDERGAVRLVDFGIGKLLADPEDTQLTLSSGAALTPDYASPEQLAALPISVASDIYSLGVILYELLTGVRPHPRSQSPRLCYDATLQRGPAQPPSHAVSDPKLRARLRGDLDTIVLKAIKVSPAERYLTAYALLDDIARHRAGRPVLARPDTVWYRGSKLIARHRTASAMLVLSCVLATIATVNLARWAATSGKELRVIRDLFSELFLEMDPARGASLDTARLEALIRSAHREAERLLPDHDSLRVRLQLRLAELESFRGKEPAARARLQTVLEMLRRDGDDESQEFVRAMLLQSRFALDEARLGPAQDAAQRAVDAAHHARESSPALVAEALMNLARVETTAQRPALALDAAAQAYALQQGLRAPTDPSAAEAAIGYGRALLLCGAPRAALPYLTRALDAAVVRYGADARLVASYRSELARAQAAVEGAAGASHASSARCPQLNKRQDR